MTGLAASNRLPWRRGTPIQAPVPATPPCETPAVTTIAELEENRTIEGVYAVARKERLRTRNGSTYLALELVDPSGRIGARVWNDVDLLDGRFETGDAVRVLGRVERFRNQLQVEVRTLEPANGVDPAGKKYKAKVVYDKA